MREFPDKLLDKLVISEGNVVGVLWKNPEFYLDYNINKQELSKDGLFYYSLGEQLYKLKHNVFDEVSIYGLLEGNDELKNGWEDRGGYKEIKEIINTVNIENVDGYFDNFNKYNLLKKLFTKGFNVEQDWDKFERMTASQVYDYFEYQLNSIAVDITGDLDFENLNITDAELDELESGANIGINYGKHSPILNYLTLGLPKADLSMIASYTNGGKSSFVTNNIIIPIAEQKKKVCIVSNEQRSIVYKLLLLTYVLTERVDYWKLTRKKLKMGKYTAEDKDAINKAREIIKNEYAPYITFVKTYDYDMGKIKKVIKKEAKRGLEVMIYDTMKGENLTDGQVWQGLIEDSKELFQICSKENIAGVVTFQLALHTKTSKRFLDETCLSNAKQVAEVFSEMIFFRDVLSDEFDGEKYDIKPYKLHKDADGKYTGVKEQIVLDKDNRYKIFFLTKTRNDENGICVLYKFDGKYNKWKELGYANVANVGY